MRLNRNLHATAALLCLAALLPWQLAKAAPASVTIAAPNGQAVEGTNNKGQLAFDRTGGNLSQPLTVYFNDNAAGATVSFASGDYTLKFTKAEGGGALVPDASGHFALTFTAGQAEVLVNLTATAKPPHPAHPDNLAVFQLVDGSGYSAGAASGGNGGMVYSNGTDPISIKVDAFVNIEDSYNFTYGGAGETVNPTVFLVGAGQTPVLDPNNPAVRGAELFPGTGYGVTGPAPGSYHLPRRFAVVPAGVYSLVCDQYFYQPLTNPGSIGGHDAGGAPPKGTREIEVDGITVDNPLPFPTPPPPTAAITIHQNAATPEVDVSADPRDAFRPLPPATPAKAGVFLVTRMGGDLTQPLAVSFTVGGTAKLGTDYQSEPWNQTLQVTFPAGVTSLTLPVNPLSGGTGVDLTVVATLASAPAVYTSAHPSDAVFIHSPTPVVGGHPTVAFTSPVPVPFQGNRTVTIHVGDPSFDIAVLGTEVGGGSLSLATITEDGTLFASSGPIPAPNTSCSLDAGMRTFTSPGTRVFVAHAVDDKNVTTDDPNRPDTTLIVNVLPAPVPDVPPDIRWDDAATQADGTPSLPGLHRVPFPPDAPPNGPNLPDWYESDVYQGGTFDPRAIGTAGVLAGGTSQANLGLVWVDAGDAAPPTSGSAYQSAAATGQASLETPSAPQPRVAAQVNDVYHFVARSQDAAGSGSRTIHLAVKVLPPPPPVPNVAPTVLWDDSSYQPTNDPNVWTKTVTKGSSLKITASGYDSFPPQGLGDLGTTKVDAGDDTTDLGAASVGAANAAAPGNSPNAVHKAGGTVAFPSAGRFYFSAQAQQDPALAVSVHRHAAALNSNIIHLTVVVTDAAAHLTALWSEPQPVVQVSPTFAQTQVQVSALPQNVTAQGVHDTALLGTLVVWQLVDDATNPTGYSLHQIGGISFPPGTTTGDCPCPFIFSAPGVYHFVTQAYGYDGLASGSSYLDVTANDGSAIDHPPTVAWAGQASFSPSSGFDAPGTWSVQTTVGAGVNVGAVGTEPDGDLFSVYVDPRQDRPSALTPPHTVSAQGRGSVTAPAIFTPTAVGTYLFSARSQESLPGATGTADPRNLGSPAIHLVVNVTDGTAHPPALTWISPVGLSGIKTTGDPATFTVEVAPGLQQLAALLTDPDGDLVAAYIDARDDTPPGSFGQFSYAGWPPPGVGDAIMGNPFALGAGDSVTFSGLGRDAGGRTCLSHLIVHAANPASTAPPKIMWLTPAPLLPVAANQWEFYVHQGDNLPITVQATSDSLNLRSLWLDNADDAPPGAVLATVLSPAGTSVNALSPSVTFSSVGDVVFSARADDYGNQSSPTIKLTIHVVPPGTSALPAITWLGVDGGSALVPPKATDPDPTLWTLAKPIPPGKPFIVYAAGTDHYGTLNLVELDSGLDAAPVPGSVLAADPGTNGYLDLVGYRESFLVPSDHFYSAFARNPSGPSGVIHLKITVADTARPPTVAWTGVAGIAPDADGTTFEAQATMGDPGPQAIGQAPNSDLGTVTVTGPNGGQVFSAATSPDGSPVTTPAVAASPYPLPGDYTWYANAQTNADPAAGTAGLPSQTIKLIVHVANHPPTVAWANASLAANDPSRFTPTSDTKMWTASMLVGGNLSVAASANDVDGNLAGLWVDQADDVPPQPGNQFSSGGGGTGLASSTPPMNFAPKQPGVYVLSARAEDQLGLPSDTIHVLVTVKPNPPTIQWLQPVSFPVNQRDAKNPASQNAPADMTCFVGDTPPVLVEGAAPDGDLVYLQIEQDGVPLDYEWFGRTDVQDSRPLTLSFASPGRHTLTARSWTAAGLAVGTSSPTIILNVNVANRAPDFQFTVPAVQSTFVGGPTVPIAGVGTDADGNLVRDVVTSSPGAFGSTATSTDAAKLPISLPFTPSVPGTVTFFGQATDDQGLTSPKRQVVVEVDPANHPPAVIWNQCERWDPTLGPNVYRPIGTSGLNATALEENGYGTYLSLTASDPDANLAAVNVKCAQLGYDFTFPVSGGSSTIRAFWVPPWYGQTVTYVFTAQAVDSGSTGSVYQPPLQSPIATLTFTVEFGGPSIQWTSPVIGAINSDATATVPVGGTAAIAAFGDAPLQNLSLTTITSPGFPAVSGNPTASSPITFPVPGAYTFKAQATDLNGGVSPAINLTVNVQDFPPPVGPVTISAVVISGADHPEDATGQAEPVVIQGGVISLGDAPLGPGGSAPVQIRPVDAYLRGEMIPPVVPFIFDMRIRDTAIKATPN